MRILFLKIINKVFRLGGCKEIPTNDKVVYLTFDDGPEDGITEFVCEELDKYDYKATFFCRGDNAETNLELMSLLVQKGHAIGNHTYSHLHSFEVSSRTYIADVNRADEILKTALFRPPHGSLTPVAWRELHNKFKIYFWSVNSGDSDMGSFNGHRSLLMLKNKTKEGAIVLFHFCHRHEKETRQILPEYLKWLSKHGYKAEIIK